MSDEQISSTSPPPQQLSYANPQLSSKQSGWAAGSFALALLSPALFLLAIVVGKDGKNGEAITALCVGVPVMGLLATICGIWALVVDRRAGRSGLWMAMVGTALGVVNLLGSAAIGILLWAIRGLPRC